MSGEVERAVDREREQCAKTVGIKRVYPLDIWTWDDCYAASWGHHDEVDFLIACETDGGVSVPTGAAVRHGYARVGFGMEGDEREIYPASGPGRGVRPITEVEW